MRTRGGVDETTTVVVTVWRHGDKVVGRVTPVQQGSLPAPGRPCASLDDICETVRDLVERAVPGTVRDSTRR